MNALFSTISTAQAHKKHYSSLKHAHCRPFKDAIYFHKTELEFISFFFEKKRKTRINAVACLVSSKPHDNTVQ